MDGTFEMITAFQYRVKALLGHDSTNTGMPTSQTPLGKKKHIPNGRIEA